jgi:hypothetical protein
MKMDLKETGCEVLGYGLVIQGMDQWRAFLNTVKNLRVT